ncbi:MAG: Fic family protein [Pirellulales bacterium]|nr:Fic family protein [Pirellulales bacterium]
MKKPATPPDTTGIEKFRDFSTISKILGAVQGITVNNRYLHWHKLRLAKPPEGLNHDEWWFGIKLHRRSQYKSVPLTDVQGRHFRYLLAPPIPLRLHEIDLGAGGLIQMPNQITNPETRDRYYVGSLIEEAIRSSQLEGAVTTRKIAKEMIRTGRPPRDKSEKMILNNYLTMKHISSIKNEPLTKELVFDLHRRVTRDTLDDPTSAGRFRTEEERVVVDDVYGEIYHRPPDARQLGERMRRMCDFANGSATNPSEFVHPAIRSIVLHFWLSYDHPFVDGNGRTARALFYWSMLRNHYWLCEFISISHIILNQQMKYQRAFLYTENDENDLTYFILYHLEVMRKAVKQLHDYLSQKSEELREVESELRGTLVLNHRQRDLISHALRHPGQIYTVKSHQTSHNVVYETARRDLIDLAKRGLIEPRKVGKQWRYRPTSDLHEKLSRVE